jgi:pentatricopeptide repeat protein
VPVADSVLAIAVRARPGWAALYELRAVVALRAGRCDDAVALFMELLSFGIEPADVPDQLMRCRRGA